jgi:hypothetical protein
MVQKYKVYKNADNTVSYIPYWLEMLKKKLLCAKKNIKFFCSIKSWQIKYSLKAFFYTFVSTNRNNYAAVRPKIPNMHDTECVVPI